MKTDRKVWLAAALAAVSMMLGGCGGNAGTQEPGIGEPDETVAEPASEAADTEESEREETEEKEEKMTEVSYSRVSVHDPSVVYDNGTYYIFGSHMAWAKSTDLMNWELFQMNINADYPELFGREWEDYCKTASNPNLNGNLWAPDVLYNPNMGKYCMYMSVNGDDWNSVIVMLTADSIEGPYTYGGPVVYSGFNTDSHNVALTDVGQVLGADANLTRYQSTKNTKLNCIDPCVLFDDDGSLWMTYGSWFGGLYMLRLDENTGLRDYGTTYETAPNESDEYYGYKLHGGFGVSGEGPYIIKAGGYYYLFVSYGGLVADGGYQMRVFRSEKITGPYVDEAGNSAVYTRECNDLFEKVGVRLMGSYDWTGNREIRVAQGHNSAYVAEDGRIYLVYHSRFADGKNGIPEAHEVRVQQLFLNADGWPVAAPYEYAGETLSPTGYDMEQMCGSYEFILHTPTTYFQKAGSSTIGIMQPENITLNEDGSVTGDLTGSWTYETDSPNMTITVAGVTYKGVFLEMPSEQLYFNPNQRKVVMTFTVLGDNTTAWGSK
ncbi:MAG: glycoside hydrolase family 43 protein [Roseburia sp.]|nr:glycoside hydrolase family 43 protein [Roseburia sp.]